MTTASTRMTEIKSALLLNQPFFASLLLDLMEVKVGKFPEIFGQNEPTMATNGKTIWVDEDFLVKMTLKEGAFVLAHEIGHAMWQHMQRGKMYMDAGFEGTRFSPMLWNIAGDYVINDMLVKSGIGKMPKQGLLDAKYEYTMTVDEVYRDLLEEHGDSGGSDSSDGEDGGSGGDDASGMGDGSGGTLDTHVLEIAEDAPSDAEWRRGIASAKDAAKAMGAMPAHLERFVDSLLSPKVPWEDKLRKAMTKKVGKDTTDWSRPHRRRLITQGVIMPTYSGFGAGTIVFAIDTSGSMSEDELKQALGEVDKITTDCNPEKVIVIGCDAHVESVVELQAGDSLVNNIPRLGGGGGTSFEPPFEWCEENSVVPDTLVYFTDTGGKFPKHEPPYPVIWCCSQEWITPPFGEIIPAEVFQNG
jgi:predicted metal-dependent peptidase